MSILSVVSIFDIVTIDLKRSYGERKLGRLVDALALGGDEGRDKLR